MKNQINFSGGMVEFVRDGKSKSYLPEELYYLYHETHVDVMLITFGEHSGLAVFSSEYDDLQVDGKDFEGTAEELKQYVEKHSGGGSDNGIIKSLSEDEITASGEFSAVKCITSVTIPNGFTSIANYNFQNFTSLEHVEIPNTISNIPYMAFRGCSSLKAIDLPNGITSISNNAFEHCESLTSVTLPDSLQIISGSVFHSCYALETIEIPSGVTFIGYGAFMYCMNLKSVTINAIVPPSNGGGMFNSTDSTMVIYVPCEAVDAYKAADGWKTYANRIQEIPNSCPPKVKLTLTDGTTVEKECNGYTTLSYYGDITGLTANKADISEVKIGNCVKTIEDNTFYNCTNLSNITIPSTVTRIGNSVFENCSKLASIDLPNGLVSIGGNTFKNCSSLTSLTIGTVFDHFGQEPFYNCTSLQSITIKATTPPYLLFGGTFDSSNNYPIYVPSESVETYKAASGWSTYADRIQAIPTE